MAYINPHSNFESSFQSEVQTCENGHNIYPCYDRDPDEPCPICKKGGSMEEKGE